jgi:hypothetical protein
MFNLLEVETGYFARLQGHEDGLSCFAFSSLERTEGSAREIDTKKKSGQLKEGGVSLMPASSNSPIAREEFCEGTVQVLALV